MINIFECQQVYNEFQKRYPTLSKDNLIIARSLLTTDFSMEKTLFITNESSDTVANVYHLLTDIKNEPNTNSKSNPNLQNKKRKNINNKKIRAYIQEQLVANNSSLQILQIKNNTITAILNNNPCIINFSSSKRYNNSKEPNAIYSWNKCSKKDLLGCDFFIFITEYTIKNDDCDYKALLFTKEEINNYIKLKNNILQDTPVYFSFKWDNSKTQIVNDIRERTNILSVTKYNAFNKNWILK